MILLFMSMSVFAFLVFGGKCKLADAGGLDSFILLSWNLASLYTYYDSKKNILCSHVSLNANSNPQFPYVI